VARRLAWLSAALLLTGTCIVVGAGPAASAAALFKPPPAPLHSVVGGFSVNGSRFSLAFADGSIRPGPFGDAFSLRLPIRINGAAAVPGGGGYWEVGADGNVYSYGNAGHLGGAGGVPLNEPMFAIAPTPTGLGYWLVSRDGGVFTFGDAVFHGSAASLPLQQPIMGITTSPTGSGYRMVARDGGVFSFGKIAFAGSLPGRHIHVTDVVGMASTPSGNGYWIARSNGQVYAFGDAAPLGNGTASSCDRFTAIVGNPVAPGYRLVRASGRSAGFGAAPGGDALMGTAATCGHATARIELSSSTIVAGSSATGYLVVDNETGHPLTLRTGGQCRPKWAVTLGNDQTPNGPVFTTECVRQPLVFPIGASQHSFTFRATCVNSAGPCTEPQLALAPGEYSATFFDTGGAFPAVAPVPVTVVPPEASARRTSAAE
jgi:hypothetical protein